MGILGGIWDWFVDANLMEWTMRLVYVALIPQTLFVLGFGLRNTWWASALGWGQFTKALAVELLLVMSVVADLGWWAGGPWFSFAIAALILAGATLQCAAWVAERRHVHQGGVPRENNPDLYA